MIVLWATYGLITYTRQRALRKRFFILMGFVMKVLWQDHTFVMKCSLNALSTDITSISVFLNKVKLLKKYTVNGLRLQATLPVLCLHLLPQYR